MTPLLERVALLLEIARRRASIEPGSRLGKTAIQKLVYLLQVLFDTDFGYRFSLYTYGPYDVSIMGDLDYAQAIGVLRVEYNESDGFQYLPGDQRQCIEQERVIVSERCKDALDGLFNKFGAFNARQLELRATLVFVSRECRVASAQGCGRGDLINKLLDLKPKYSDAEVAEAIDELVEFLHI